jgi:RNA polymerase sigma-70 factor (ECF subfamily)
MLEASRVIKGNQAAACRFADLVDEYGTSVYRFCRSLTFSKEDADDLFQETFLKALERQPKIYVSDNPQGFLFSSSLYVWKSWKRKYARRERLAPSEPLDETAVSGDNVENSVMAREETRAVRGLVEALPDKFKIPTILYYTAEMSVADIALILRLPAGTVKSRLFKARKLIEKGLVDLI